MSFALNIAACMRCPHGKQRHADHKRRCDLDGVGTIEHAHAGSCTIGKHAPPDPEEKRWGVGSGERGVGKNADTSARAQSHPPGQSPTSALWRELHLRALHAVDLSAEPAWLATWLAKVPCGSCRNYAAKWLAANPLDVSSPAAYFAWSVRFHNSVNADLNRPEWTVEEARMSCQLTVKTHIGREEKA